MRHAAGIRVHGRGPRRAVVGVETGAHQATGLVEATEVGDVGVADRHRGASG